MKYLTYIFIAGLLLVVGCGVSTADIDATVEARIASIPTPTPQIIIQEVEVEVVINDGVQDGVGTSVDIDLDSSDTDISETGEGYDPSLDVEVVVPIATPEPVATATPVPPTATPTPLPTATATPTSDASGGMDISETEEKEKAKTEADLETVPDTYQFFFGCSGTGTIMFDESPMRYEDFISIRPYGHLSGAHVTPIDHMYFNPMDRSLGRDSYEVRAIADGVIYYIKPRDVSVDSGREKLREWRVDTAHTCSFHSYFDLLTSLSPDILTEWEKTEGEKNLGWNGIPVKAGQLIGNIGGQTLDFGVYDYEIVLEGFIYPEHYTMELWKIHTVDPFQYFPTEVREVLLQKNLRKVEPFAGKIDYDIDGKLSGNWFEVDTNWFSGKDSHKYWDGHLSIVPNHIDPTAWMFAIGNWPDATSSSGAADFKIVNAEPSPSDVGVDNALIKYELSTYWYCPEQESVGCTKSISTISPDAKLIAMDKPTKEGGVALVQLIEPRLLKVEVFPDKTPSDVDGFTENAKLYER